jgi:hypothetical protein
MKNKGVLIGIILGTIAFSAGFNIVNKIRYKGNDVTKALSAYKDNSTELKVTTPESDPGNKTGLFDFHFKYVKKDVYADKDGSVTQITFYSKEYKKFFNLLLYDLERNEKDLLILNIDYQQLFITVNKDDLSKDGYGTKSQPVPVFKFDVISPKNDYPFLHTTQEQYTYNVTQYLKYVMPKDEFNNRFGK